MMKDYSNPSRKPMMYGGEGMKKDRKKMQMGGMSAGTMPMSPMAPRNAEMTRADQRTGMAMGGKTKMAEGGKPMKKDPKTGEMKPTYAMDGKGKMMYGGKSKKK